VNTYVSKILQIEQELSFHIHRNILNVEIEKILSYLASDVLSVFPLEFFAASDISVNVTDNVHLYFQTPPKETQPPSESFVVLSLPSVWSAYVYENPNSQWWKINEMQIYFNNSSIHQSIIEKKGFSIDIATNIEFIQ
jgi:hypothetical protein